MARFNSLGLSLNGLHVAHPPLLTGLRADGDSDNSKAPWIIGGLLVASAGLLYLSTKTNPFGMRGLGQHVAPRRARAQGAKTTRGWKSLAPKTKRERDALLRRCGPDAFLDPAGRRFPIVAKNGPCEADCRGIRAAKARARQYGHADIARRADTAGRMHSCRWA